MEIRSRNPLRPLVTACESNPYQVHHIEIVFGDYVPILNFKVSHSRGRYTAVVDKSDLAKLINLKSLEVIHPGIKSIKYRPLEPPMEILRAGTPPINDCIKLIHTNGIELECRVAGNPRNPLVVMIHGFPDSFRCFDRQIDVLKRDFFIVAPNTRGYGMSSKPSTGYDLPTLARDIAGLIEHFGSSGAQVVGHDFGGAIAWALASDRPELVKNLTILNAPHPKKFARQVFTSLQLFLSWYIFFFQIPLAPELILKLNGGSALGMLIRSWSAKRLLPTDVKIMKQAMLIPGVVEAALRYYKEALRSIRKPPPLKDRISLPVNIIWGTKDRCLGIGCINLWSGSGSTTSYKRIACGHWLTREASSEVTSALRDILFTK